METTIVKLHKALGELIEKGTVSIPNGDLANDFEEMICSYVCVDRKGNKFVLKERVR